MTFEASTLAAALFLSLGISPVMAAEDAAPASILSPADGAKLPGGQKWQLEYEAAPSAKADHVHLFVDGTEAGTMHKLKGSFTVAPLPPGPHKACIKVVNKNHTPIGTESCISVTVE